MAGKKWILLALAIVILTALTIGLVSHHLSSANQSPESQLGQYSVAAVAVDGTPCAKIAK